MAKALDFNAFEQPTLEVVLCDDAKTKLSVTAPTEELIEKLEANQAAIVATCKAGNKESIGGVYKLAADLMSCNEEGIKVEADELRTKYRLNFFMLFKFMQVYMGFVEEIKSAKN